MSPSSNQEKNLSTMTEILSGNWKASILAWSLWKFFNYHLYCTVRDDDGEPNRHRVDGISGPETIETIRISISIRNNERREEGLVHELLHSNLIPLGYPRFWINDDRESEEYRRAAGIINLAEHKVMRPIFLSLGYSAGRFVGPSRPLNELETRIDAHLEEIKSELLTSNGFSLHVSTCLADHGVSFHTVPASLILREFAG